MQQSHGVQPTELTPKHSAARYVDTLYRHWLVVLIPILVLPVAVLGMARLAKGKTTVGANIYFSQNSVKELGYSDPMATPATNAQAALQQLLLTRTFDVRVAKASPLYWATVAKKKDPEYEAASDLGTHVKVTVNGPNLDGVSYSTKTPAVGLQVLQSLLKQAPREILKLERQQATAGTAYYTQQAKTIQRRIVRHTNELGTYASEHHISSADMATQALFDSRFATLYPRVQGDQTDLRNAQQRLSQAAALTGAGSTIQVIDTPSVLPSSSGKKTLVLDLAIGLIVALFLSGTFVVVTTARDHSMRSADEVSSLLGIPVLASLPYSKDLVRNHRPSAPAATKLEIHRGAEG